MAGLTNIAQHVVSDWIHCPCLWQMRVTGLMCQVSHLTDRNVLLSAQPTKHLGTAQSAASKPSGSYAKQNAMHLHRKSQKEATAPRCSLPALNRREVRVLGRT
jgi:hypothetical protein